ncbi:hypothetical protein [Taklimakanibacter lacteus]|uniref:hypothetical protein n=1 Tax=Taklimakanibacter lacteus TaxID=2268456 RepID=UPI000E6705A8
MLTRADLDEAVKSGIITEQQSLALASLPEKRRQARHVHALGDERFVFMKNFNEFFIALGVVLLAAGIMFATPMFVALAETLLGPVVPYLGRNAAMGIYFATLTLFFIVVMWALAEYLTRKLKLTLPSIVLALFIVPGLAYYIHSLIMAVSYERAWTGFPQSLLIPGIAGGLAAVLFYLRFRLPFALLLLAGSCVVTLVAGYARLFGYVSDAATYGLFLFAGLATLAAAQRYDMSDRERITRRSDCGFWLTLIAAPLIVHPIAGMISSGADMTAQTSFLTIAVVVLFALAALIIDRRALLVSSLAYLGGAMLFTFTELGGEQNARWITLLLLGTSVILLGVGWHRARRAVMQFVPSPIAQHLPVVRT